MIKIAIVDDEKFLMSKLCGLIEQNIQPEQETDIYSQSSEYFNSEKKFCYDLVFLDIDMPDIDGFTIAGDLKSIKPDMNIIFVSNKENLVVESIRYQPLAFIRKSNMERDFVNSLDLIYNHLKKSSEVFCVEVNDVSMEISLADIMFFEAINHDLYIQTMYNNYKKKRNRTEQLNLKKLSEKYKHEGFILVNRNYLVNYKFINVINSDSITLKNGSKIVFSPRNAASIKRIYQQFLMTGGAL